MDAWGVCDGGVPKDHPQTAAAVLHRLQLSRYQVIDFHHQLITESLIFARFSAVKIVVGLYTVQSVKQSLGGTMV